VAVRLAVRLTQRGGRDAAEGWARDAQGQPFLKARVTAPPMEGAANAALVALIAKALKVSRGSIRIISGDQSRLKILEIDGAGHADLEQAFGRP
jgi:uncharacterized protein